MKNKTFVVASMILVLGVVMLFGTSYSLITNTIVTDESYGFNVSSFDVEFLDNTIISLNGIPTSDEDALKNGKEFTFTVSNNSNYDVNYRLDIIENSPFKMDNVVKYTYSLNNEEYQDITLLSDNYTIEQNRVLKKNEKDVYKLKLWLSIDADETYMNKKFQATISLFVTHNENKYATNVLETLASNNQDGVVKENDNYRYIGNDVNNYVWFNCQNNYTKGIDYCEKWQIVGSFNNTFDNLDSSYMMLKLINTNVIEELPFNNEDLKGDYDESYIISYANGKYYDSLNDDTKKLIVKAKWNIGSTNAYDFNSSLEDERLKNTYTFIGLLNTSDYLYIKDNSWINYNNIFTINKNGDDVNIISDGKIDKIEMKKEASFIPVVYIKPDISIISGDGSINNPYELSIKYPMNFGKIK